MKKPKGRLSILESIRNKMKKIENHDSGAIATNSGEEHEEFEYIDDSSKNIVESKQSVPNISQLNHATENKTDLNLKIEDNDFDFLTRDQHEEVPIRNATTAIPDQNPNANIPDINNNPAPTTKKDDLNLDLEEDNNQTTSTTNNAPIINDDLDLDLEEEITETPKATNAPTSPINNPTTTLPDDDLSLEDEEHPEIATKTTQDDDLDLDIDEEPEHAGNTQQNTTQLAPENDIDLDSLKEESSETEVKVEKHQDDVLDEELENIEVDKPEQPIPSSAKPTPEDDINLDDLEIEEQPIKTENKKDDLDLDQELENIEVDNLEEPKPIQTKLTPKDDIDIMAIDNALEKTSDPKTEETPFSQSTFDENQTINNINNNMENKSSIISETVANQTKNVIKDLMQAVPKKQELFSNRAPAFKSGETIEEMVSAILTPKLEQWLNENLPTIVEKVVKDEIKKLIPKDE